MSFMRRVFGGRPSEASTTPAAPASTTTADEDEIERVRALAREEATRLSDDLLARQIRYADRAWTPPAQGGPRRADDRQAADADADGT